MKKIILFLTILNIYISVNGQTSNSKSAAETIDKLKAAIASMHSGELNVASTSKYLDSKDTVFDKMKVKFFKNTRDDVFLNATFNNSTDAQTVYDGESIFRTDTNKKEILKIDPKKYGYYITYSLMTYLFAAQYPLLIDSSINNLFADKNISAVEVAGDTVIDKTTCLRIVIRYHPMKNFYKSRTTFLCIDSKRFTPVNIVNILINDINEIQYTAFRTTYDSVNALNDKNNFSFAALPADFAMTNYYPEERSSFIDVGLKAPDFSLKDINGKTYTLKHFLGKTVLLDFWHLRCGYCLVAMPEVQKIAAKHRLDSLVVLGINPYDKDKEKIKQLIDNDKLDFVQLIDGLQVNDVYKVNSHPAYYLVDKKGIIIYAGRDREKIESLIKNESPKG